MPNFKNGTTPMGTELTAADACRILKAAKEAGVRKLAFRGLEFTFGVATPEWPKHQAHRTTQSEQARSAPTTEEDQLEQEELRAKEDRLAEMPLTDPLEMERLLALGELRDATDGTADEEA